MNVHSSMFRSSQKVESTLMSTNKQMKDKQNVIYPCARISFNHKKGMKRQHRLHYAWTLNTGCRAKEAEHKRAQIVWFCLYETPRTGKSMVTSWLMVARAWAFWGKMSSNFSWIWGFSGEDWCHVIKLTVIMEEKAMAPHSSTLAWKIPLDGGSLVGCSPWGR